jgi:sterol desaturase/sphingolipid hydroxylase (fatty acid hydroxylase superfamily)
MEKIIAVMQSKAALVLLALLIFLVLDRVFPMARVIGGARRVAKNLSLAGINAVLSWLIVVPVSALAAQYALGWRPLWWNGGAGVVLDLLILDCWIYWWHRANHELPFLWRFHEVHHLDEFLDASSALRFHFGEVFLSSVVRAAVIFLLGVPIATVLLFETVLAFAAMFHHSNVKLPAWFERPLSLVIVTPSIHWVHHHAIRADTDSNYSTVLSIWDRLFGSRSNTRRTPDMAIGVEGRRDRNILGLLKRPFES